MVFGFPDYMEVLIVSILLSVVSVLISKIATNQGAIRSMKAEMKSLNERIKKAQKEGNQKLMNALSGDLMKLSGKQFQMNMKPMFISLFIFLGIFWFFGAYYGEMVVSSPINIPFLGNQLGWFHWYFMIVLPGSFMFRKLLGVE
jgi:uncharacterized membrane protein (DUF106 family)